jgi:hypothetical protein
LIAGRCTMLARSTVSTAVIANSFY